MLDKFNILTIYVIGTLWNIPRLHLKCMHVCMRQKIFLTSSIINTHVESCWSHKNNTILEKVFICLWIKTNILAGRDALFRPFFPKDVNMLNRAYKRYDFYIHVHTKLKQNRNKRKQDFSFSYLNINTYNLNRMKAVQSIKATRQNAIDGEWWLRLKTLIEQSLKNRVRLVNCLLIV